MGRVASRVYAIGAAMMGIYTMQSLAMRCFWRPFLLQSGNIEVKVRSHSGSQGGSDSTGADHMGVAIPFSSPTESGGGKRIGGKDEKAHGRRTYPQRYQVLAWLPGVLWVHVRPCVCVCVCIRFMDVRVQRVTGSSDWIERGTLSDPV